MRILHSAMMFSAMAGVVQQMRWEQIAGNELGLGWDCRIFGPEQDDCNDGLFVTPELSTKPYVPDRWKRTIGVRRQYYRWLKGVADEYDALLLRHTVADPMEATFISECAKPVFTVHHTLEVPELVGSGSLASLVKAGVERYSGAAAVRASCGVIGVTREIASYECERAAALSKPAIVYPNGVVFGSPVDDARSEGAPEIVFVAGRFSPWHGLDLMLEAVERESSDFTLHLVGEIDDHLMHRARKDDRIRIYGRLSAPEIRKLYARSWVGLSSFALFRNGMREACTLKVREYLSAGLPTYAGYADVFPGDVDVFKEGPACMSAILEYALQMRSRGRHEVAAIAEPYISKRSLLKQLEADISHCLRDALDESDRVSLP